jgi:hypothetical protein
MGGTSTHYDTIITPILRTRVIPPNKPLWNLQQQFCHYGNLLPKEKNFLNDWNERVAKAKLDDLRANYFAKQKRH